MSFTPERLAAELASLEETAGQPGRYVVAFSGGLDSTVLLHALASLNEPARIVAVHVDHALQEESAAWEQHCRDFAASLGVAFDSVRVEVSLSSGKGLEAAAREARYAALMSKLSAGDCLLSAHHREDQAETLLFNLIRGSGPAGVAGIGGIRSFGPGWLARPLLNVNRCELLDYAQKKALHWIEDPSNADRRFDRNFLRHEVLPQLESRWPDIAARLQRSAGHAGEASELLAELARIDLDRAGGRPERLRIDELAALSAARQRNLIRHCLRVLDLSTPTALQLDRILEELLPAREDAQPLISWPGTAVRRYRNGLYLMPQKLAESFRDLRVESSHVELGTGLGALRFEATDGPGLNPALIDAGLTVRSRQGGEEIRPLGQSHTRKLKKLLQEEGVVPWMRNRLPLIYAGEQLVAVGDLWMADAAASESGISVQWERRPALH